MTFRPSKHTAIRAVHALAREAADMPVPRVDWDRVEESLWARIGEVEKPVPSDVSLAVPVEAASSQRRLGSVWTMALAAAAGVALVTGGNFGTSSEPMPVRAPVARAPLPLRGITLGDSLELGGFVSSKTQPLVYEKPGLVTFTVAPSSRVELVAADQDGERPGALTLALKEGSVHAEVEPQAEGEAFAVEVEHTRVAVHGTSFTVTREGDRVIVEVAHGSVAVGPTGYRGSTQGWLLVGPDQASFSLDGGRDARWLPVPPSSSPVLAPVGQNDHLAHLSDAAVRDTTGAPARKQAQVPVTAPTSARASRAVAARAEVGTQAPDEALPQDKAPSVATRGAIEQEDAAKAGIARGLESCYERQASSFGVSFSIASSLTLSILPNGTVHEGLFNPPLSPTLMNCARDTIMSARFPAGPTVREIRVPVNLVRR